MGTPLRIAAVAAVLLVTGCGSSGGGDKPASQATPEATAEVTVADAQEAGRVRKTTKSFFAALVNGHGDRACAMLEETNRRAIRQLAARRGLPSGLSCGDAVDGLAKKRRLGAVTIGTVAVDGNRATVDVSEAGGGGTTVELVKEGDAWKLLRF
jgi:hypothetical protein